MIVRWLWLLVAASSLPSCGRVQMTRECRRLSAVVESARREVDQVTGPKSAAAYRASAPLYAQIARRLQETVASHELRAVTDEYARTVKEMAPSVTAYAEALESNDATRVEAARIELDRAARRERFASRRLEDQCHDRL